jgi:hypothetical protein
VLLLHTTVVVTHQLTPYILLPSIAALALLRLVRPWPLLALMTLIAVAYLAVNFAYLRDEVGLFSGFNPLDNASTEEYVTDPVAGKELNVRATQLLSVTVWLGAAAAAIRLCRIGRGRAALGLMALAAAPFVVVFGQSYGGEALYRVYLFSMPWCACLIAWALGSIRGPRRRVAAMAVTLTAVAVLAIPALLGQEEVFQVSPTEVQASEYLYGRARTDSVMMFSGPYFPVNYNPRYSDVLVEPGRAAPELLGDEYLRSRLDGPTAVQAVTERLETLGTPRLSRVHRQPGQALEDPRADGARHAARFERAIAASPRYRLWYRNADVRIYELEAS